MKCTIVASIVVLVLMIQTGQSRRLPDWLPICKRNDPELNICWRESFQMVISKLDKGIPEMNLRAIDPVNIDTLTVDYGNGTSISFIAQLSNLKLYGANKGVLDEANIDLVNAAVGLKIHFPSLHIKADYVGQGKILLFRIDSKGKFLGDMTDLTADGVWYAKSITKKGKEHFLFDKTTLDLNIKSINVTLENLFPTSPELTETTNKAINENIDVLYLELKPIILETIKTIVEDSVNNVYALFPLDELYPE